MKFRGKVKSRVGYAIITVWVIAVLTALTWESLFDALILVGTTLALLLLGLGVKWAFDGKFED